MTYSVSLVQTADIPRLAEIQWAALNSNPLTQVLYPRGPTPALSDYTIGSYKRTATFPSAKLIKATNTATSEIVGFAKWILYRKDEELSLRQSVGGIRQKSDSSRRSSGWEKETRLMPTMPPDCHGILLEKWGDIINKTRKRLTGPKGHACRSGAPCSLECYFSNFADNLWVLDIVHVIPLYQKNGVGSALLGWGLEQADKEGLPCYVESSPSALPLCVRRGFKHVGEMRIELGRYKDGYRDYRHVVMIRPPYGKEEALEPPPRESAVGDERAVSPVSPISPFEDESEIPYTAEAKMLEFRSTSSLRSSAKLTHARGSSRSLSKESNIYRDIPAPLPKGPGIAKLMGSG